MGRTVESDVRRAGRCDRSESRVDTSAPPPLPSPAHADAVGRGGRACGALVGAGASLRHVAECSDARALLLRPGPSGSTAAHAHTHGQPVGRGRVLCAGHLVSREWRAALRISRVARTVQAGAGVVADKAYIARDQWHCVSAGVCESVCRAAVVGVHAPVPWPAVV